MTLRLLLVLALAVCHTILVLGPASADPGSSHQQIRLSAPIETGTTLILERGERLRLRSSMTAAAAVRWTTSEGCALSHRRAERPVLRCVRSGVHSLAVRTNSGSATATILVLGPAARGRGTGRLAYVATDPAGGDQEIWTAAADGTDRRQLTDNDSQDFAPAWSPNGRWLSFTSDRAGSNDLYVMRFDGSRQRSLTNDPAAEGGASSWSPDGSRIAFTSQRAGNRDIHTVRPDGTGEQSLTSDVGEDRHPSWSPDGSMLSFHSQREGDVDPDGYDVYVMNGDGTCQRDVSNSAASGDGEAAWVPQRLGLSFASYDRPDGFDDIVTLARRGGPVRNVTQTPQLGELEPAWTPDGRRLSFAVTTDYESFDLYVSWPDGTGRRLIVAGGSDSAWQPR